MKSKLVRFIDLQFTIERVGLIDTDQNPPPPRPVACRPAADSRGYGIITQESGGNVVELRGEEFTRSPLYLITILLLARR